VSYLEHVPLLLCVLFPFLYFFLYLREKWCRPWWSTFFTAAKTSNATAEANNALLKVAYNIKADSVVKLIRSTHQRSIDDQGKSLIQMDNSVYEVSIAKGLTHNFLLCLCPPCLLLYYKSLFAYTAISCYCLRLFIFVVNCT
jgi:hypothetical protein